jgi:nickel transport protein
MEKVRSGGVRVFIVLLIGALVLISAPAFAHKVTIFAWVEGDRVFTESKFSGGRKVTGGKVAVFDPQGTQLLEGKTDEKGEFSFRVPKLTDLRIVLNAGTGHRAEWKISKSEIRQAGYREEAREAAPPHQAPSDLGVPVDEIREIIDESLDRKLTPIAKMLAELQTKGPSITEVIGGIGYIVGLMGIALYFLSKRKKEGGKDHD